VALTVVPLGALAALLFGSASALQQRAAARADALETEAERAAHAGDHERAERCERARRGPTGGSFFVRVARRLVHDKWWIAGVTSNTFGFFAAAAALHFGSVAVVQPLLTTQLIFAVALASLLRGRGLPGARDWLGGLLVCAGLAVFLAVRGAVPQNVQPVRDRVALSLALAIVVAAVLAAVTRRSRSRVASAALLGVGSGMFFALTSVLTKLTTASLLDRGVAATAVDWIGYALAASALFSQLFEQSSFAAGPLPAALTAETIAGPVTGYLIGVFTVHAPLPTTPGSLAATVAAAALLVAGVVLLAHSPLMTRKDPARLEAIQREFPMAKAAPQVS
jgi:drug/metabolite transporter (DMT)-like permease